MKKVFVFLFVFIFSGIVYGNRPTAKEAYLEIAKYAQNKDWGAVYDNFDAGSKFQMDSKLKAVQSMANTYPVDPFGNQLNGLNSRDLFVRIVEIGNSMITEDSLGLGECEVLKAEENGDRANLTVRETDGAVKNVAMIFEQNAWKILVPDTQSTAAVEPNKGNETATQKPTKLNPKAMA